MNEWCSFSLKIQFVQAMKISWLAIIWFIYLFFAYHTQWTFFLSVIFNSMVFVVTHLYQNVQSECIKYARFHTNCVTKSPWNVHWVANHDIFVPWMNWTFNIHLLIRLKCVPIVRVWISSIKFFSNCYYEYYAPNNTRKNNEDKETTQYTHRHLNKKKQRLISSH